MLDIVFAIPQPSELRSLLGKQEPIARSGWVGSEGRSLLQASRVPGSHRALLQANWNGAGVQGCCSGRRARPPCKCAPVRMPKGD
eukprot:15363881-Alexandrium_andersonii.AAC.1